MLIKLVGSGKELADLSLATREALAKLSITDFVSIEETDDSAYKAELGITANPALCIEESSIEFRDMIFEGIIPEQEELVSMFASIFGVSSGEDSCGSGE